MNSNPLKNVKNIQIKAPLLTLAIILLLSLDLGAQIKKGQKFFDEGRYAEAVKPLKKDFYGKESNLEAGILLAKCYYQLREYQEALDVMVAVGEYNLSTMDDRRFYADVLIVNDDFSGAYISLIQLLSEDQSDPKTLLWLDKVGDLMKWDSLENHSNYYSLHGLNTVYNEYGPFIAENGEMWFVNDHTNIQAVFPSSYNNQNMHLFYKTKLQGGHVDRMSRPTMLMKKRDYYYHDGPLDKWDGTNMHALTLRDLDAPLSGGVIGIYFSQMTGAEDDIIAFKHNGKFNTGHPTFLKGGKRMIFSSDRPGGYGQMDLWYSDFVDGTWTEPKNMGPIINTPFNEVFPNYYDSRIYYSSDRQDMGYGALDVYYTSELLGYSEVYNLREPMNGPYDDFGLTFISASEGYFASNRKDGHGGDDIFGFVFIPEQLPIKNANLQIVNGEIASNTEVKVYDSAGNLVATTAVGDKGRIEVENLKSREVYTMKVAGTIPAAAMLNTIDNTGEIKSTVGQTAVGEFKFELLDEEEFILDKEENVDDSRLIFDLEGKVVADDTVNVSGVFVTLIDLAGDTLAITHTGDQGDFKIEGARMGENYIIQTSGMEGYHEIDVYGESGALTQSLSPMGSNQFSYMRAAPAATWMLASEIAVPAVFAIIPSNESETDEEVILYDENDVEIAKPQVDEDGFMPLGTMVAGKAYRLYMPDRTLTFDDRLVILDGNGDTSQTVRPFDQNNYFFEYLLYKDYGAESESEVTPLVEEEEHQRDTSIYKLRIRDFEFEEPTPLVLTEIGGTRVDTVFVNPSGIAILRGIDPSLEYELALADTAFSENKVIEIYDSNNTKVFEGETNDLKSFRFQILEDKDHILAKEELVDDSFLTTGFSGTIHSQDKDNGNMTVSNAEGEVLVESNMGASREFDFQQLEPGEYYIVSMDHSDESAYLMVFQPGGDSLRVDRQADGKFYVNFEGEMVTLMDNDKPVKVSTGTTFNLDNVYYDFNSLKPKSSSLSSLDKLVQVLKDNPDLRIEVLSHTDSRGPSNYNTLLSQKRAQGVIDYLASKGIERNRLKAKGLGESQLTNKCADNVRCTNAEHAKNRRTEFKILGSE